MGESRFSPVKTHKALAVAVAEASLGGSDWNGLVVDHVQVGIDAGSGPGEDGKNQVSISQNSFGADSSGSWGQPMGCSDRHGLVLGHVQVGIDASNGPGEV